MGWSTKGVAGEAYGDSGRNKMTTGISEAYRELTQAELDIFEETYESAWKDPAMPERQYRRVVADELQRMRVGEEILPYKVALDCLRMLPAMESPSLLDVGASSGYYSEVLKIGGFDCQYTACDYSPSFQEIAKRLYPGIRFDVADARALPYETGSYEIVLHGAVVMHLRAYRKAIAEAARVSKRYVILHRTAIEEIIGTTFYAKEAYSQPTLEVHLDPKELQGIFDEVGLKVIGSIDLFMTDTGYGHRSYVLEKCLFHHPV